MDQVPQREHRDPRPWFLLQPAGIASTMDGCSSITSVLMQRTQPGTRNTNLECSWWMVDDTYVPLVCGYLGKLAHVRGTLQVLYTVAVCHPCACGSGPHAAATEVCCPLTLSARGNAAPAPPEHNLKSWYSFVLGCFSFFHLGLGFPSLACLSCRKCVTVG